MTDIPDLVALVPAPGWFAMFDRVEEGQRRRVDHKPLAGWAHVGGDHRLPQVFGLVAEGRGLALVEELDDSFVGYTTESSSPEPTPFTTPRRIR